VAAVRLSGERLLGSGSIIGRGKKGEEERRGRGFYSCGWSSIKAGSDEGLRGGELLLGSFGPGREGGEVIPVKMNLPRGSHLSVVVEGRGGITGTGSGEAGMGHGLVS
jgi:hypothetical protein